MSPTTRTRPGSPPGRTGRSTPGRRGRTRAPRRREGWALAHRRRIGAIAIAIAAAGGIAAAAGIEPLGDAVREVTLPLRHDDIIRQQAEDKDLDPALIAAIIYEESRFRPQTSPAGAEGLMQITPETADFIARNSGATTFVLDDLGTPQINISYGSFYLRYLIDRYNGDERLAIAAYNAGATNVDQWLAEADSDELDLEQIPFPETREYVADVEERRKEYEKNYAEDLGL
jgi:soluble lytic murein transglycosylase